MSVQMIRQGRIKTEQEIMSKYARSHTICFHVLWSAVNLPPQTSWQHSHSPFSLLHPHYTLILVVSRIMTVGGWLRREEGWPSFDTPSEPKEIGVSDADYLIHDYGK